MKLTHEQAGYQERGTLDEHCRLCSMFVTYLNDDIKPTCTAVEDPIEWYGWCEIFEPDE